MLLHIILQMTYVYAFRSYGEEDWHLLYICLTVEQLTVGWKLL
jgi:hypothetical protein